MALPYESYNIDEVGAKNIPELQDVVLDNLVDGEVLAYNSSTEKWENSTIITGAGSLDGLTDTNISTPLNNQFLVYNSSTSKWENNNVIDLDTLDNLSDTNITSLQDSQILRYDSATSKWLNVNNNIEDINNITINSLAATEILKYNGTKWVNSTILVNELQDVNITSLQNNEVLKYNSTSGKWENKDNTDSISELQDTNITSLANNNILKYNSSSSKWVNTFVNFDELQDVNLHTLTNGAILKYNSSNTEWETSSLSLNELNNVNTSGVADTNVLKYDSTSGQFLTGAVLLNEISGVTISSPLNNQFLIYNSSTSKWENSSYVDFDTLDNLGDTNITSLTNKDILVYDSGSSKWINSTIGINDLNDVNTAGIATPNVLKYNGSSFVPGEVSISEIPEINITAPGATEVLKYNGTKWVNQPVYVNEINGIDLTLLVNNELLRKDGANNSVVGADIITSTTTGGGVTTQKTLFVETGVLTLPLSSIESKVDNGVYSMTLNPFDINANQKGVTLLANNNNTRVGINVANPSEDLEIDGNIQLDSNNQSRIIFYDTQNDHEHAEIDALGSGTNGGQLIFNTKNDGGSVSEKMRITDDGGVGIGTTSPSEKLDVNGNIKVNNTILGTSNILQLYTTTNANNSYSFLELRELITSIGCPEFRILTGSSNVSAGSEKLKILSNGNVGIGTSTPSQKLQVNGTIRGNNLITEGYLDLNPDGGLEYNAQLRHDKFIGSTKPDQVKMFLRNHNFWTLQEGIGNGGDGTRKMIIDAPLEVNATIKSGISFYVYDILHQRYANSAYEIQPALGWSGNSNTRALLALNQYTAALRVYNDTGAEITSISPYKDGYIYYRGTLWNVSDDRLKSYETDVSGATDMILKLKPKFYKKHPTLITDDPTPDLSGVLNFDEYGFIAQELKEDPQLSHFVRENPETEIYHVNYVEMIPLLVQTIKELNERIKVLESHHNQY
jgi:hypothetical protein